MNRCGWVDGDNPLYVAYHDLEWGVPVHDDRILFEFLLLEGAQAGLSWVTVLRKRENYREAFAGFEVARVAKFTTEDCERVLENPGIIRNRLKVRSAATNARKFIEIQQEFGSFDTYLWQFAGGTRIVNRWRSLAEIPASTPESDALSADLRKRGFTFVGTTICYAYMQAVGLVNDHTIDCFRHAEIERSYA